MTPKDYAAANRASKVRERTASGTSVTEAIYDAGFNSSGRFYEKSTGMLGMTPSQYVAGGANEEIRFAVGETSLGTSLSRRARREWPPFFSATTRPTRSTNCRIASPSSPDRRRPNFEPLVARVVGFVEAPPPASISPLTSAAPPSNSGSGRHSRGSRSVRPSPTRKSRGGSALPTRCARSPAPAPRTASRSLYRVTGWFGMTGRSQATRGVSSVSRPCLRARRHAAFSAADTVWRVRNLPSAQRNRHL